VRKATLLALSLLAIFPLAAYCAEGDAPAAPQAPARLVSAQEVRTAIQRGVDFLKTQQRDDGSWSYRAPEHTQGLAALCVYAMGESGVREIDPALAKGMDFVLSQPLAATYDAGCAALAITSVNPAKYIRNLAQARDYLVSTQGPNGMWVYSASQVDRGGGDNSNTQFAMLGLNAAMSVGLDVPLATLRLSLNHYAITQNPDGGWGYRPGDTSYGSMTAAGVSALSILGSRLFVESDTCG
jgi:squalene cyclase